MTFKRRVSWLLPVLFIALLTTAADACPTCKDGISDGSNHVNVVRGYFWSIIFMMAMPFVIFGSLGTYFYFQVKKARSAALPTSEFETNG